MPALWADPRGQLLCLSRAANLANRLSFIAGISSDRILLIIHPKSLTDVSFVSLPCVGACNLSQPYSIFPRPKSPIGWGCQSQLLRVHTSSSSSRPSATSSPPSHLSFLVPPSLISLLPARRRPYLILAHPLHRRPPRRQHLIVHLLPQLEH